MRLVRKEKPLYGATALRMNAKNFIGANVVLPTAVLARQVEKRFDHRDLPVGTFHQRWPVLKLQHSFHTLVVHRGQLWVVGDAD
jgi:hypothetical protein